MYKSNWTQTWPDLRTEIWPEKDPDLGTTRLSSHRKYMPDKTSGISNAVSFYKAAVQTSATIVMSLFDSF